MVKEGSAVIEGEEEDQEGSNGANDQENASDKDSGLESGAQEDLNAEGEGGESEEGAGEDGGEAESTGEIAELKAKIAALEAGQNKPPAPVAQPVREWTPQEWEAHTERTGISKEGTQFFNQQLMNAMMILGNMFESRFANLEVGNVVSGLSFKDAPLYKKEISDYLMKFDSSLRNKPEVLEAAYFYAKNKFPKKGISNSRELDRRVISRSRLQPPSKGGKGGGGGADTSRFKMTETEESGWASFGQNYFKTKDEYIRSLPRFLRSQKK